MLEAAVLMGAMLVGAPTEDVPKASTETVAEESTCNGFLQQFQGAILIELHVDPDTFKAAALYLKKLGGNKAVLILIERPGCETPWSVTKAIPIELKKPPCKDTDSLKCL